jgi:CII-binding regulator of phage lambda lysogenization HflD
MNLKLNDDFDFGFSLVDENELDVVQQAQQTITSTNYTVEQLEAKLNALYNAILPLLNNLQVSPEKEYLYWPDRASKVKAFKSKIDNIIK